MSFLKRLFGKQAKLDGAQLAQSDDIKEYAQLHLLMQFLEAGPLHEPGDRQRWSRTLLQSYNETIARLEKEGWLDVNTMGEYRTTPEAQPFIDAYRARLEAEKQQALKEVAAALQEKQTSEALSIRRRYEARFPLGAAEWTGDDPQLSHSALTRRIFFLDYWLLEGLSESTVEWLKFYAAEQHLWGAYWRLAAEEIPESVREELARPDMDGAEATYWKAFQLTLYVDNQDTWQRCKGGDHVRRIVLAGPNDADTCDHCREFLGKEYLVARVPDLPHRACTSPCGCRCRYEPVLESYEESDR